MSTATWLLDAARQIGYPVVEVAGWQTRGHGQFTAFEGVVGHHTGTPDTAAGDYPSLRIVRDGRSDLPGPLCNYGLGRSGTVYVVAAGVAWHAGTSCFAGFTSLNDKFVGIEAESAGGGHWTDAQLDAYPKLVASALRAMGRTADRYVSHRTCATPAGRKPDPTGIDDAWMRDRVTQLLAGGTSDMSVWDRKEKPWGGGISNIGITQQSDLAKAEPYDLFEYVKRNNVETHQTLLLVQRLSKLVVDLSDEVSALKQRLG